MKILSVNEIKLLSKDEVIEYGHKLRSHIMKKIKYCERFDIRAISEVFIYLTNSKEFGLLNRKENSLNALRNHLQTFNTLMCFNAEEGGLSPVFAHYKSEKYNLMLENTEDVYEMYEIFYDAFDDYNNVESRNLYLTTNKLSSNVENYIENFFEPNISIIKISKVLHLNSQYMMRKFKEQTGETIKYRIDKKRLEEAKKLILCGVSLTEVSYAVGFSSPSVFTRVFKKYYKITPSEYRDNLIKGH